MLARKVQMQWFGKEIKSSENASKIVKKYPWLNLFFIEVTKWMYTTTESECKGA